VRGTQPNASLTVRCNPFWKRDEMFASSRLGLRHKESKVHASEILKLSLKKKENEKIAHGLTPDLKVFVLCLLKEVESHSKP